MKPTFKNFLTETDDFEKTVAELQNDPYLHDDHTKPEGERDKKKDKEMVKIEKIQKVFDPVKWRKYLQYANAGNN